MENPDEILDLMRESVRRDKAGGLDNKYYHMSEDVAKLLGPERMVLFTIEMGLRIAVHKEIT